MAGVALNMLEAPMPRVFLTCTLLDCKAHVAPVFQGRNGGPGRMVLKLGPIQGHGGHYPPPASQHMTVSADGLLLAGGEDLLSHQASFSQHLPV